MNLRSLESPQRVSAGILSGWRLLLQAATLAGVAACADDGRPPTQDPLDAPSFVEDESVGSSGSPTTATSAPPDPSSLAHETTTDAPTSPSVDPKSSSTDGTTGTTDTDTTDETSSDRPRFAGLPIPIAYVGMTDTPSGVTQFAAAADFVDCPTGLAVGWNQQMMTGPLWSDCVAAHITDRLNLSFQELLNTDQQIFESVGYSTFESPEYSVFASRAQVDAALQALDTTEFNTPGQITAIISNWTHSIGGLAPYDQPLDDANGIVLAISQVSDDAVIHEVGHALGFAHTDEDPEQTGRLRYDFCGELEAPVLPKCNCEMNLMEAVSGVCAPQCGDKPYTFSTPTHGEYFRDVASCWLSERRFAGNAVGCIWPDIAECVGYENTGMTCTCLNGNGSVPMRSCSDATQAEIDSLLDTCDAEFSNDNLCMSFTAYPGVYCFENDGNYDCACLSDDTPLPQNKPCEEFTPEEIYSTCLGSQPEGTCEATRGNVKLSCVETNQGLSCICSDTGSTLDSSGSTCANALLDDWIESCPLE